MARQHFCISAFLSAKANHKNFDKLITSIDKKGYVFYKLLSNFKEPQNLKDFFLNTEYIINKLCNLNKAAYFLDEKAYFPFRSKYQDTILAFIISGISNGNKIAISWNTECSSWDKNFPKEPDSDDVNSFEMRDNARYSRLMLNLVEHFPLNDFSITEEDIFEFEDLLNQTIKAKFMTELANDNLAHTLTYNVLYNKCIMLDSYENQTPYSINEFKKLLEHHLNYRKEFKFVVQQQDQFLAVIIDDASKITITPINYIKKVTFESKEFVDIPFYVRLMLGFCEDLAILELRTNFK